MGRAVIAMTAVRRGTCVEPGKVTDHPDIRPPTDVMAITSLPQDSSATCHPYLNLETRTRYPTAETCDPKVFLPQPIIRSPVSL